MFKFVVFLFLCLLFLRPDKGMTGVKEGLLLWYTAVLPAQLPFTMGIRLFMKMISFNRVSPVIFNFFVGMIAGYPMGSLTTAQLHKAGYITKRNVTSLAALSNMAGPLFILGTVGTVLLGNVAFGYILLAVHWLSVVAMGGCLFFLKREGRYQKDQLDTKQERQKCNRELYIGGGAEKRAYGQLMGETVEETAGLMLKIAGFMVLFSVLKQWVGGAIGALLELSGGIQWVAEQNIEIQWKLIGCSFLLSFSGGCVILQSLGTMEGSPVSALQFIGFKLIQGGLAAGIMFGICQFLNL